MTYIDPILAFHYFTGTEATEASPVRLYFDTNVIYSIVRGISDLFYSQKPLSKPEFTCKRFWSDDTRMASVLLDRPHLFNMLSAHKLELYYLLKQRPPIPTPDIRTILELFFTNCFPPESLDLAPTTDGFQLTLDSNLDRDHAGLKCIHKLKSFLITQPSAKLSEFTAIHDDVTSGITRKSVDRIINSELFALAFEAYSSAGDVPKSEQAKVMDSAAICMLADMVEQYNDDSVHVFRPAPFFIASTGSAIFNAFQQLMRNEKIRARFLLRHPSLDLEVFAFQPTMFLDLIFAYSSNSGIRRDWPVSEDAAKRLVNLGGKLAEEVVPFEKEDATHQLNNQIQLHLWQTVLQSERIFGGVTHQGNLEYKFVIHGHAQLEESELINVLGKHLEATRVLAREIAWTHRAETTARLLKAYFESSGYTLKSIGAFLKSYDLAFGIDTALSRAFRDALVVTGGDLGQALTNLLQGAWRDMHDNEELRRSGILMVKDNKVPGVEKLVSLLWISTGSALDDSEFHDLSELLEEIVFGTEGGPSGWQSQMDIIADLPTWLIIALIKCDSYSLRQGFRTRKDIDELEKLFDRISMKSAVLEARLTGSRTGKGKLSLMCALAASLREQAYFKSALLILRDHGDMSVPPDGGLQGILEPVDSDLYLRAVDIAWRAFRDSREGVRLDVEQAIYVTNLYLYILVSANFDLDKAAFENARRAADVLVATKSKGDLAWLWLYDHTLSMYLIRLALFAKAKGFEKHWHQLLAHAKENLPTVEYSSAWEPSAKVLSQLIDEELFLSEVSG